MYKCLPISAQAIFSSKQHDNSSITAIFIPKKVIFFFYFIIWGLFKNDVHSRGKQSDGEKF